MKKSIQENNWLDIKLYPFTSKYINTVHGKVHYIDEGKGDVILFVHGTPTWSFLYRDHIKSLSNSYRCIAIDHLGFGLSDKPTDFDGTPESHSYNLASLIEQLELKNITLVVHDFGGPIGLSYAVSNPKNIKRIVLFNTWLWETKEDKSAQKINRILHSPFGNFIYLNTNFSPNILLKKAFYDKRTLSKTVHTHFKKPFPNKRSRYGLLKMGKSLIGSSDWYGTLWERASAIQNIPTLILWGLKDQFIRPDNLTRWEKFFNNSETHTFESGHFVQEESKQHSIQILKKWIKNN